jgi:hypothetical protein
MVVSPGVLADDVDGHRAQLLDAALRAQVDRVLQERDEQKLRQEDRERHHRHRRLNDEHVAEDADQDAGIEQRVAKARADEAPDRFHLGHRRSRP